METMARELENWMAITLNNLRIYDFQEYDKFMKENKEVLNNFAVFSTVRMVAK